jgi:hypothetical protein
MPENVLTGITKITIEKQNGKNRYMLTANEEIVHLDNVSNFEFRMPPSTSISHIYLGDENGSMRYVVDFSQAMNLSIQSAGRCYLSLSETKNRK